MTLATLESIAAAMQPLPRSYAPFGDFLIAVLEPAEKAYLIDLQESMTAGGETASEPDNVANIRMCAAICSVGCVDETGRRVFDSDEARQLLERAPFTLALANDVLRHNGMLPDQYEAALAAAKKNTSGPPGGA